MKSIDGIDAYRVFDESLARTVSLLITIAASSDSNNVFFLRAVLPELAVLTFGPLIKDLGALLRCALPIDSKAIGEV
nr:hypothetical protein [Tanacetum cinerariifolium]